MCFAIAVQGTLGAYCRLQLLQESYTQARPLTTSSARYRPGTPVLADPAFAPGLIGELAPSACHVAFRSAMFWLRRSGAIAAPVSHVRQIPGAQGRDISLHVR